VLAVTATTLSGIVNGDNVTVSAIASYSTATVGAGITITAVYTLGGADAANYVKPENYVAIDGAIAAAPSAIGATTVAITI